MMKWTIACSFFAAALMPCGIHALEPGWKKIPADAEDYEESDLLTPDFATIKPLVPRDELLTNLRVQSPDKRVEFAFAGRFVKGMGKGIEARKLPLPLREGEKVVSRVPSEKKIKAEEGGDYILYDEQITVAGPDNAYTRHFKIVLSTGTLPGTSTMLWEFQVKDDKARAEYAPLYAKFKQGVSLGED